MAFEFLQVERAGAITKVTLARPEKRNAIHPPLMQELIDVAHRLHDDEQTRAVIVRAAGRDFSVGADLDHRRAADAEPPSLLMRKRGAELGSRLMHALQEIPQPTICAVHGIATGAGACIGTACDFRLAADDARIGYGEVKIGINLMWHALPVCVHLIGPSRAKQMVMTGKLFPAETLHDWGFVDALVPRAELDGTAEDWAREFCDLPPIAVQMIKRSIDQISGALDRAIMHADVDQWLLSAQSEDFREAIDAFFAKRKPTFHGR